VTRQSKRAESRIADVVRSHSGRRVFPKSHFGISPGREHAESESREPRCLKPVAGTALRAIPRDDGELVAKTLDAGPGASLARRTAMMATAMKHWLAVLGATTVLGATLPASSRPPDSATRDLLERYDRGDYDSVAAELAQSPHISSIRKDLDHSASAWAEMPAVGDVGRRRVVVATFGLEVARAQLETEWQAVRSLIETGCEIVRRNPPGLSERLWQLASVALAEGGMDAPLLLTGQHHLSHASASFPTEPRFRLAKIVMDEMFIDREARGEDLYPISLSTRARQSIVATSYKTLFDVPAIGAEAHLRAGYLRFQRSAADEALAEFIKAADLSDDPFVAYLAQFLSGRTLAQLGRSAQAEDAFRRALEILPDTQSASEALSAQLFSRGLPTEAYALVDRALVARPHPADPWRLYGYGDFRMWPRLILQLREALRAR
jgi:tetratricopeptide (TPR) repeat protein